MDDVFKMGWIIGQWKPSLEYSFYNVIRNNLGKGGLLSLYQPKNYLKAPKYKSDQEAKGIAVPDEVQVKYKPLTVAGIQRLTEDDYFYTESQDSITLKLAYNYNKTIMEGYTSGVMKEVIDNLWLFNYFNLFKDLSHFYFVPVTTCRYPNQIAMIRVFPQVEWTFHVNYGMKNPLYYRDTWVEMRQHRVEAAFNRGQAADIDGYDGDLQTTFSLALECKWNKTETAKFDQKISENIKVFIGTFLKIKGFVDQVTGKDKGTSPDTSDAGILARIKRTPLSIEVLSPKLSVAAGWKYDFGRKEQQQDHMVASTFEIKAKADPLIGAQATIDLIAWGKKLHPAANAVITALDLLAYAANADVRFDLIFYGKLVIEGNTVLSKLKKEGQLKAEGQFGFRLILMAKAVVKFSAVIYEVDLDFEAKAEGIGYFSAGLALGLDDYKGAYFQPIVRHSGIKIILTYKVAVKGKERTTTEDFPVIAADTLKIDQKYYIND